MNPLVPLGGYRIALQIGDEAVREQLADFIRAAGHTLLAAVPDMDAEGDSPCDLLFIDHTMAREHIAALRPQACGHLFMPIMAVLPAEEPSAPWLDAGCDDVLRLPLISAKAQVRIRVLLRLRGQSLAAEQQSIARNHMILDSAIDAVITFDRYGRMLEFNPAAEAMFRYAREDVLGCDLSALLIPADMRERYVSAFTRYLDTGHSQFVGRRAKVKLMRSCGEEFPAEINITRVEAHGRFSFTGFVRDLTQSVRAEAGLAELAAILGGSDEAIIGKNLDGRITTWNNGAELLFGYGAAEAVGQLFTLVLPPEHAIEMRNILLNIALGRRYIDFDAIGLRKNGERIDIALRVSPVRSADGSIIGASTIAYDTTERKRARLAVQQSEERYRSLVAATTSIVWLADGEGRFIAPQASWERYTAQSWPACQGFGWTEMLHPEDRTQMLVDLHNAIHMGALFEDTVRLWHAESRQFRYCVLRAVPVLKSDQSVREWVGTITDVDDSARAETAIREMNLELEQRVAARTADLAAANHELEAFSYSVSHDLRAPLRAIAGFSRIVLDSHGDDLLPEAQRLMHRIGANVERMDALITDLLTFSRMSRMPVTKRLLEPDALMREVAEELCAEQGERQIDLQIASLPSCSADPSLLRQVFVNLISNALKYTRSREVAKIEVSFESDDPLKPPVYFVRDNGIGFDMRYAAKLFQVFERLHSAQEAEGTGVGLALVQRIIERHGGQVWAHAVPDQGACFYFTLERSAAELSLAHPISRPAA